MRALMEDPEQKAMLLDDPALVPQAVEEALRMFLASPTSAAPRPATSTSTASGSPRARRW